MLVLTRKLGEEIVIGNGEDQIIITIVDLHHGRTKIGIKAGDHIKILRGELVDRQDPDTCQTQSTVSTD